MVLYFSAHPLADRLGAGPMEFPAPLLFILIGHFLGLMFAAKRYR